MAAKLSEGLGEQVTCAICLEHFSDPRLLPCLHTYCRRCLQALLTKGKTKGSIVCPECREEVQIVSGDVTKLKVNFWINNLLSLLAIHSTEKQHGGKAKLTCENCDSKEVANVRCVDCCMFLCEFCSTAHKRYLATKHHQLMTLDEMKNTGIPVMEKQSYCTKHKGEVKKLFCNTCQELICRDCTIIDHRDHKFNFVEDVAEQHKQLFKTEVGQASATKNNVQEVLNSVRAMKQKVEKTSKATEKDVDAFIDKQIKALEEKRKALKQDVQKFAAAKIKELAAQEDGLTMHLTGLKSAIEFTEKVLTKGGNSDVLSISKQLIARLKQLTQKSFPKNPCQETEMGLEYDKNLFRDFLQGCQVVGGGGNIDHDECSVARLIQGRLVQIPDSVVHASRGENLEFVIEVKNSFGQKLRSMADSIDVLNRNIYLDMPPLPIASLKDNTYTFTVQYGGRCSIEVLVDGKNIPGSPINIHKKKAQNQYGYYRQPGFYNSQEECSPGDPCYRAQPAHW